METKELKKQLPPEEVNVRLARCPKCKNPVYSAVEHTMSKDSHREMYQCVKSGCTVETISLLEYKKLNFEKFCDTKCK